MVDAFPLILLFQMLELGIQKPGAQIPTSPTSANRLQQYFSSSSFLLQQEQIALFIKDFPIIVLKDIKNINILIDMLIKQNQLLAIKCQQQVNLMKDTFSKHEKMVKANKEIKMEREKIQKQKKEIEERFQLYKVQSQSNEGKKEEYESIARRLEAERMKMDLTVKESQQIINTYQQVMKNITSGNYKRCEQTLKENSLLEKMPLRGQLENYCQKTRKQQKYYGKVKNCIEQFCNRLEKVVRVVSQNVLASELRTQICQFLELIDDMIETANSKGRQKKRKTEQSQKSISDLGISSYGRDKENTFFEGMILKLTENAVHNNNTKEQITKELQNLRKTLSETKEHYEKILEKLKAELEEKDQKNMNILGLKQEEIKHYEEQLYQAQKETEQANENVRDIDEELSRVKRELEVAELSLEEAEAKIVRIEGEKQEKINNIRRESNIKAEQMERINQMKTQQREELIKELSERRKKQQSQYEEQLAQNKKKMKSLEEQNDNLNHQLKKMNRDIQDFEDKCSRAESNTKQNQGELTRYREELNSCQEKDLKKNRMIEELKQTLKSLQHEKNLQTAYIGQLQSKTNSLQSKIKTADSKNKSEASLRKEITAIKNSLLEEKGKAEKYESYCLEMKEENQRLKMVVKEMKKELEEVYIRVEALKQIQYEREQIMAEAQNSERLRGGLVKDYEDLKFEMLRQEAQNKKLALQLKHFKNIVNRIDFVEESHR